MESIVIKFDPNLLGKTLQTLKRTDLALYKSVRSEIRKEAGKIKTAMATAVQGLDVSGARGGGGKARFLSAARITPANMATMSLTRTQIRRGNKATSLRSAAARTLAVEVREKPNGSVRTASVRIRMRSSQMPSDQYKLPKYMNKGKWRHPVFGNTDNWVTQTASPAGWFDETFNRMRPAVAFAIQQAIVTAVNSTK